MEDIQHQQMGYDRAATMFAPDGHILQVEYAEKTARLGSASLGIVYATGVLIVADRRHRDELVVDESASKINEIDEHILAVSSGITSDARVLIERARVAAQNHRISYDSAPGTESIVREVADVKQQFTQYGGARPFGVAMMFAGMNGRPDLYTTDIMGNYLKYHANAIGENDEKIKEMLRAKYKKDLDRAGAIKLAMSIFKEVLKEKFEVKRFDVAVVEEGKIKRLGLKDLEKSSAQ